MIYQTPTLENKQKYGRVKKRFRCSTRGKKLVKISIRLGIKISIPNQIQRLQAQNIGEMKNLYPTSDTKVKYTKYKGRARKSPSHVNVKRTQNIREVED